MAPQIKIPLQPELEVSLPISFFSVSESSQVNHAFACWKEMIEKWFIRALSKTALSVFTDIFYQSLLPKL